VRLTVLDPTPWRAKQAAHEARVDGVTFDVDSFLARRGSAVAGASC
jgi:hypothetical protein